MSLIKLEEMLQLHMFPWLSRCPSTTCLQYNSLLEL